MKTTRNYIKVSELFNGYKDLDWDGVVGYGGKLDIRPKYQREFIYKPEQQRKVIETIINQRPLNLMYWVKTPNDNYELLDGQQRTLSICKFLDHKYHIEDRNGNKFYFDTLPTDIQDKILNYELEVYICEGSEEEILEWFDTINIKGSELEEQEKLNAAYSGPWLESAKRYFSKPNCRASIIGKRYLKGEVIRQKYLETTLKWINNGDIKEYMGNHRYDTDAEELKNYFEDVIKWVEITFPKYRDEMVGIGWGFLYNQHKDDSLNPEKLEKSVSELMKNEEIQSKSGIYTYVLEGDEKVLNLRAFKDDQKRVVYEKQKGICPICHDAGNDKHYELNEMHADHIIPWSKGGKTEIDNCQMLCIRHNLAKKDY